MHDHVFAIASVGLLYELERVALLGFLEGEFMDAWSHLKVSVSRGVIMKQQIDHKFSA